MDVLARFRIIEKQLVRLTGERDALRKAKQSAIEQVEQTSVFSEDAKKARAVLQLVAQKTQQELEYQVGALGSLALKAVFTDDPYNIVLRFDQKRGKTEAVLRFVRPNDKTEIKPVDACGGGAVLLAAFALRLTFWKISHKKTMPVMFLDEPFHFLSKDLRPRAAEVLQEIASQLKIQVIMVTHEEELLSGANRVYKAEKRAGVSIVNRISSPKTYIDAD